MRALENEINELAERLNQLNWSGDVQAASQLAEELALRLGEPTPESVCRHLHDWTLVWEGRGNFAEATRLQEIAIEMTRRELLAGDYDLHPQLLKEQVEYQQDGLYLQALRHQRLGNTQAAQECIRELYSLAQRYSIGPDDDAQSLFRDLGVAFEPVPDTSHLK